MIKKFVVIAAIFSFASVIQAVYAQNNGQQEALDINLYYKDKKVDIIYAQKTTTFVSEYKNQPDNGYQLLLTNTDGKQVYNVRFDFPLYISVDSPTGQEPSRTLTETSFLMTIPYFQDAASIVIQDPEGHIVAQKTLSDVIAKPTKSPHNGFFERIWDLIKGIFEKITTFISNIFHRGNKNVETILPDLAPQLTQGLTEPTIVASNSDMVIWYYPQNKSFSVVIISNDVEGVKKRAYDWFKGYKVEGENLKRINFTVAKPEK